MKEPKERIVDTTPRRGYSKTPDSRGQKKTNTVIPETYGIKCYTCKRPTRTLKINCKKCMYDIHYSRRLDAYGNRYIEYEDYINDKFYD
jgi:hypothetical protein